MKRFGLLLFSLVMVASGFGQTKDEQQVISTYNAGIERFNAHDLAGFMQQFAPSIEMYTPTGWLRGQAAVEQRFAGTFKQFPKVKMVISNLKAREVAKDTVVVDFEWEVFPMGAGPQFKGVGSGVYVRQKDKWGEVLEHETVTFTDPALQAPPKKAQ